MKTTKWVKQKLETVQKLIIKLETEMEINSISYFDRNNFYTEINTSLTYGELLAKYVAEKTLLIEILKNE